MATRIDNSGMQVPLTIRQGATFGPLELKVRKADGSVFALTNATLRGQIRKAALDVAIIASFQCSVTDAPNGLATIYLPDTDTVGIACAESPNDEASQYTYDVEMVDTLSGAVTCLMRGAVTVVREVTR